MLPRFYLLLACMVIFSSVAYAQITQINPYYGYTLSMPIKTYYGEFNTDGGNNFGINVSFGHWTSEADFTRNMFIELQYNYQKTPLEYYYYYSGGLEELGDLKLHNGLIGVLKGAGNEIFEGYGGVYAGVTIFDVEDPEAFDYTRFTLAAGAGVKYYPTLGFGLRFHTQLYLPMWASSTYMDWSGGNTGTMSSIMTPYMNFNLGIFVNIDRTY